MIQKTIEKMQKTIETTKRQFQTLRTGRASTELLSRVQVEYYGSIVPLQQVASVSIPESTLFVLSIFDKTAVKSIEKAIQTSDLGLNPQVDGTTIRLRLPELTEERRKDLVKLVKKYTEEGKVSLRNVRRDFLEELKGYEKNKELSEDELKRLQDEAQKVTDQHTSILEKLAKDKEVEIMKV